MKKAFIILIIIFSLGIILEAIGYIQRNIYIIAIADIVLRITGVFFLGFILLTILNLAL